MCKKKNLLKINYKKILKIIIVLLFILMVTLTFNKSFANDSEVLLENNAAVQKTVGDYISGVLNGLLGIFFWGIVVAPALILVVVPYLILSLLFMLIGNTHFIVTPADIFYNRIPLLSIDFFDFSTGGSDILLLRSAIAKWFVTLSGVSLVVLLGVLIYIAIRAVMASTGQSQAKYYKMFVNWLVSLGLLGLLGIIIVGSITANNVFVRIIEKASLISLDGADFSTTILRLMGYILSPVNIIRQISATLILAIITIQTFKYAFIYIKRMIKIAFLIIIAPLITITYSIDKIADNKSQALNTWMHVFIYNVFIQTFHALIFSVFFTMAFKISVDIGQDGDFVFGTFTSTIPATIIAIMSLMFIGDGEQIIRKIFGITDGEKLPQGGDWVKFGLAQRALDYTSKKLKTSADKQEKPHIFEGSLETTTLQPRVRSTDVNLDASTTSTVLEPATRLENVEVQPVVQPTLRNTENILDENIRQSLGEAGVEPKTFKEKAGKTGKGIVTSYKDLYGKKFAATSATVGAAMWGIASGDFSTAWGLIGSARNIGKMIDKDRAVRRERKKQDGNMKKSDRYVLNTKDAAKEALNAYGLNQMINGESPEINSQEQIDQMQSWFRMISDKADSGKLLKEYEKARKEFIQKLKSSRSLTTAQATVMAHRLEESLMSGRIPQQGTMLRQNFDTLEGRNLGNMVMERKQMLDMKQYNELESNIKDVTYDYDNVKNILATQELISAVYEYDNTGGSGTSAPTEPDSPQQSVESTIPLNTDTIPRPGSRFTEEKTGSDDSQQSIESTSSLGGETIQRPELKSTENSNDSTKEIDVKLNKSDYKKELEETTNQLSSAEKKLKELEKEYKRLEEDYNEVESELQKAEKAKQKNKTKDLELELDELTKQMYDLDKEQKEYKKQKRSFTKQQEILEGIIEEIMYENAETTNLIEPDSEDNDLVEHDSGDDDSIV